MSLQFSYVATLYPDHRALAALEGFTKDRGPGLAVVKGAFVVSQKMGRLEAGRW